MTYLWTTGWKMREERREKRRKTGGRCGESGSENKIWTSGKLMKKVFLILTAVERMFGCDGLDKRQELTLPDSDFGGAGEWRVAGNLNETDSHIQSHWISLFPSSLFLSEQSPPFICYRSLVGSRREKTKETIDSARIPHPSHSRRRFHPNLPAQIRTVDTAELGKQNLAAQHHRRLPFPHIRSTSCCPRIRHPRSCHRKSRTTATTGAGTSRLDPVRDFAIAQLPASTEGPGRVSSTYVNMRWCHR